MYCYSLVSALSVSCPAVQCLSSLPPPPARVTCHVSRVQSTIVWHCHNTAPTLNSLDQAFTREEVWDWVTMGNSLIEGRAVCVVAGVAHGKVVSYIIFSVCLIQQASVLTRVKASPRKSTQYNKAAKGPVLHPDVWLRSTQGDSTDPGIWRPQQIAAWPLPGNTEHGVSVRWWIPVLWLATSYNVTKVSDKDVNPPGFIVA